MNTLLEILKYTLPAIIVLVATFLLINKFLEHEKKMRKLEINLKNKNLILPIRLQAYERIALFLERINLDSLIFRAENGNTTVRELQSELLSSIRAEFDHNLSQQIYISDKAWRIVKIAKENTAKIINSAAMSIKPEDSALDLSKTILGSLMKIEVTPTDAALAFLKTEMQQFY